MSKMNNNCESRGAQWTPTGVRKVGCTNFGATSLEGISTPWQSGALVRLVGFFLFFDRVVHVLMNRVYSQLS